LETLDYRDLAYIEARSNSFTVTEALRSAKINKAYYYDKPQTERDRLDEIALMYKRDVMLRANIILDNAVVQAAEVKAAGLKSRDERVKQSASTEILDRRLGKPVTKAEITGKDGGAIPIEIFDQAVKKVYDSD